MGKKNIIIIILVLVNIITITLLINEFCEKGRSYRYGIKSSQILLSNDIIDVLEKDTYSSVDLSLLIEMNSICDYWLSTLNMESKQLNDTINTLEVIRNELIDLDRMVNNNDDFNSIKLKEETIIEIAIKFREQGNNISEKLNKNDLKWYFFFTY